MAASRSLFELTEQTRQAVDDYLKAAGRKPGQVLFPGRRGQEEAMSTRQYARLVSEWTASIGLDPHDALAIAEQVDV